MPLQTSDTPVVNNRGSKHTCFRCPTEFYEMDGYYDITLGVRLCGPCGYHYLQMCNQHNTEERNYLQELGKGRK